MEELKWIDLERDAIKELTNTILKDIKGIKPSTTKAELFSYIGAWNNYLKTIKDII